jgi:hypothetical protein
LRSANRRQESVSPWVFLAQSFMGRGTIQVISTDRGIMLPDIIGDLPVTSIIGVPIGATGIGDITAGIGIKIFALKNKPGLTGELFREVYQISRDNIPSILGF